MVARGESVGRRTCKICRRVFQSGKALGGHVSSHVQRLKTQNATCPLCGLKCRSLKSLCGHMRHHPNRGWKGIFPPNYLTDSSSASIDLNQNKISSSLSNATSLQNLAEAFPTWSVTGKRGRKAILPASSVEENPISEADVAGVLLKLGEEEASLSQTAPNRCQKGKGLRSHRRLHWTSSMEAGSFSSAVPQKNSSKAKCFKFDFDLNELPAEADMEVDD